MISGITVKSILRHEIKGGAEIIRSNTVFYQLREPINHNHRITNNSALEENPGHLLPLPCVEVR